MKAQLIGQTTSSSYQLIDTFNDLPAAATHRGKQFFVKKSTGIINRKPAGIYESDGTDWLRAGFLDAKNIAFDSSSINSNTITTQDALVEVYQNLANVDSTVLDQKADINHTHANYADVNHTHSEYANATHSHSEYANANHTHTINIADIQGLTLVLKPLVLQGDATTIIDPATEDWTDSFNTSVYGGASTSFFGKSTTTPSSNTGASGQGTFFFIETSSPNFGSGKGGYAEFKFGGELLQLQFQYHRYGATMPTFNVEIDLQGDGTWTSEFILTGQQHTSNAQSFTTSPLIDLKSASKFRFSFKDATNYYGDMCLKDIKVWWV